MPTWLSLIVLTGLSFLLWLDLRTLFREMKSGVPHLFFSPHPAFRGKPGNHKHPYLWFSVAFRIFGTLVLGLMVFVAFLFLLESLGVIYQ